MRQPGEALGFSVPAGGLRGAGSGSVLLLIEGDRELSQLISAELARSHRVETTFDGETGLARALAAAPDLILCESELGGPGGVPLVRALRTQRALDDTPLVVLAARADEAQRRRLLDDGAQDFVTDPRSVAELRARVAAQLGSREARQALRESAHELNRAQAVAQTGSWHLDVPANQLRWSAETYRMFGIPPGTSMTYETFLACVHPDDRALVDRRWRAALGGAPYDLQHRIVVGGEVRWVRERAELTFDASGAPSGGIGTVSDVTGLKNAEEALRQSEGRMRELVDQAPDGILVTEPSGRITTVNRALCELMRLSPDQLVGKIPTDFFPPDDAWRFARLRAELLRGEGHVGTWQLRRGDGLRVPVEVSARQLSDGRLLAFVRDIGERVRADEALRLSQARFAGIVSIAHDAIVAVDAERKIVIFNQGAERLFGYTEAEALGASLESLIPARLRPAHAEALATFDAGPDAARRFGDGGRIWGLRKNGEEFPADAAISRLEIGGRRVLTLTLHEVSEQLRVEREQRLLADLGVRLTGTMDEEELPRSVAELGAAELADLCQVEVDGVFERRRAMVACRDPAVAAIAAALQARPLDFLGGRPGTTAVGPAAPFLLTAVTPEDLASVAQNPEQQRLLQALAPRSMLAVPLLARGQVVGSLALLATDPSRRLTQRDVPLAQEIARRTALAIENARLYRTAQRAVQDRDEVMGVVAHDLRNPLAAVLLQSQRLRRDGSGGKRGLLKATETIERAALRMNRLIQDLLDVVGLDAGQLDVRLAPTAPRALVVDAVEAQRELLASASLRFELDLEPDLPDLPLDRDRLLQVFENLLGNAAKFTGPGGRVVVGAARAPGEVVFRVSDTGIGLSAEELPHAFDRFWQARKAERRGTGLGLAIVKGVVEAHGGRVWVESTAGAGSTFYFSLPEAPGGVPPGERAGLKR